MGVRIAVIGATGKVGQEMLKVLSQFDMNLEEVFAVASERSANKQVSFGEDKILTTTDLNSFDFSTADIALFAISSDLAAKYAPIATSYGCIVIDNSSHFRMDKDVPLVIPEVNPHDIADYTKKNIIANPNCCAIPLIMALHPLHQHNPIERVIVSTYQSVSGAGKVAMEELYSQTKSKYMLDDVPPAYFPRPIAFNVQPHIGGFMDNGYTEEEWKIRTETQKILDHGIIVDATCVRVPVFIGHSESIHIEFSDDITTAEAYSLLKNAPGIAINSTSTRDGYVTPIETVGEDHVFISRLRQDPTRKNTLTMWVVSDNLRKGAALNAVQIAQHLVQHYL